MRHFRKLVGTKCYLSPVNLDDAEAYTEWLNDLEVTRTLNAAASSISISTERAFLEKLAGEHAYGIVDMESDTLIGNVGLIQLDHLNRHCGIGIFIGNRAYWGRGYGPEAMRLLIGYAFDRLNMHSVRLTTIDFNERGLAAYRKLGFKETGRRRESIMLEGRYHDEILMDLLEGEFRAAQRA